MSELAYVIQS